MVSRRLGCLFALWLAASACRSEQAARPRQQPQAGHDGGGAAGAAPETAGAGSSAGGTTSGGKAGDANADAGAPPEFDASGCIHPDVEPDCSEGFCKIPAGCFVMGSPKNEPGRGLRNEEQTAVTLTHAFLIGQYEVTQEDFALQGLPNPSKVFEDGPYVGKGDCLTPECPVGNVNWYEAIAFANLLSERNDPPLPPCYTLVGCTGELGAGLVCQSATITAPTAYECQGYRLPTDAEWEYAARAGTRTAFYAGAIDRSATPGTCSRDTVLDGIAWYCNEGSFTSHPVGELTPNAWGLYDALGNLEEWINDPDDGRSSPSELDPRGKLSSSESRYTRGGSVYAWPTLCRAASQGGGNVRLSNPTNGFRLARTL